MAYVRTQTFATKDNALSILRNSLARVPEPLSKSLLIIMVGLPGTGKTHLAQRLVRRFPAAVLESDRVRGALFRRPSHSFEENSFLFDVCHELIEELLMRRVPVVLDATNLVEANRQKLYDISDRTGSALFIVKVYAPREVVKRRLALRVRANRKDEYSHADWDVYKRMESLEEHIGRRYYVIDTSRDVESFIENLVLDLNKYLKEN